MNLFVRISILILCLIIAMLLAAPFALDNSSLKFQIEQKVSQKLNNNFEIKGNVDVAFLPLPKIIINNANLNNYQNGDNFINLKIKKLILKPALLALFRNQIQIDSLIFETPQMEINPINDPQKPENKDDKIDQKNLVNPPKPPVQAKFSDHIFNLRNLNEEKLNFKNIGNIEVIFGSIIKYDDKDQIGLELSKIGFTVKNQSQKFTLKGNFVSENLPTEFKMTVDTKKDNNSYLSVNSPILKLDLNGKFNNTKIENLVKASFDGKFNAEIINLKSVLGKYISRNNLFFSKINNTKSIKISSNIKSQEGEIKIDNIVINSQLITGGGNIEANFSTPRPAIDIDIAINNIDIDSFWAGNGKNNQDNVNSQSTLIGNFLNSVNTNPEKTKLVQKYNDEDDDVASPSPLSNIDLTADIKIKTAKYMEGELKDISLYFIIAGKNQILLQPLLMKVPGGGILRISGIFEDESGIPKFVGKIDGSGKDLQQFLSWLQIESQNLKPNSISDYKIMSDIMILPNFIALGNLYISINNNKNLLAGSIKYDNSGGTPNINSEFIVNELNVDDYFLISDKNQYLSNGSLLQKLLWLNSNSSSTSLSLFFNKLIYKQNVFLNQPLKISFGQGYFKLNDLKLKSDDINIEGFLNINIANNNPLIDLNLKAENFRYITKKPDENDLNAKTGVDFKSGFVRQFFNLPSFDNFNGAINLDVKNLVIDDTEFGNVKLSGKLTKGELAVDQSSFDLYNGNLKYSGNIIIKSSKAFNGTFTLTNIENQDFLKDLFNIKNVSGISNISGAVSFVGKNRDEFFKNMDMQLKFVSGNVLFKGFGIDDLLKKMLSPYQYQNELSKPLNILFNDNSKTYFKDVSGTVDIRRGNRENKLRIETASTGVNSVTTGSIDLATNIFEGTSNFIFLTGTRQKQIPINIAINYKGKFDNLQKNTNIDQVNQYLNNIR